MKKSRRWFSLLSALIVALAMTILMTAVSFADGEERVCTFSDGRWDPDPLTISVGETVRIDNTDAVNGTKIGVYNHETEEMVLDDGKIRIEENNGVITVTGLATTGELQSQIHAYKDGEMTSLEEKLYVTVEPGKYTFDFDPGETAYDGDTAASGLNNVMQLNLKSEFKEAWIVVVSGIYKVEITSDKALTYKDLLGIDGALEKSYAGADPKAFENKLGFGCKSSPSEYKDSAEFDAERGSEVLIPKTGAKFYALTSTRISNVELTVQEPKCGAVIKYDDSMPEIPLGAHPEVTLASAAKCSVHTYEGIPYARWIKGEGYFSNGDVLKGDENYTALIALKPNFGYTMDEDTKVTINKDAATVNVDSEDVIYVTAPVTAVHDWDEGTITKEPTTTEEGVKTFKCKACEETKTEAVPKKTDDVTPGGGGSDDVTPGGGGSDDVTPGGGGSDDVTPGGGGSDDVTPGGGGSDDVTPGGGGSDDVTPGGGGSDDVTPGGGGSDDVTPGGGGSDDVTPGGGGSDDVTPGGGGSDDPTPVNPTPVNPTPVNPTPVNPTPVNPQPAPAVNPTTPAAVAEIVDLPAVKISKPKAAKKKITVKWKKVSKKNRKKISGIQIQVATDPGFTNIVKTVTAGKKKSSKVIKGLQPKTKYYVRIRAYAAGDHVSVWKSKSAKVK